MNNSKGFKMKSSYGSGLKQTGKMEAVGSMARRAQYDKLGWAYDETIPVQGPSNQLQGSSIAREKRQYSELEPKNALLPKPAPKNAPKNPKNLTTKGKMAAEAKPKKIASKGVASVKAAPKGGVSVKSATKEAKPKTRATTQKASTANQKALVKQFTPKKEVRKAKRTVKKVARKSAKSTKKVSRLEGKLEAAKKAKK